jgi:hypothetical protein
MKKILLAVVVALVFGITIMAEGADWTLISDEVPDGKKWYVDKKTIQCLPDTIKARVKKVSKGPDKVHNRSYKEVVFLNEFDRKDKKLRELQIEIIFMDGGNSFADSNGGWMRIMRDSPYEAAYNYVMGVCK